MKIYIILFVLSISFISGYSQNNEDLKLIKRSIVLFQNDFNDGLFTNAEKYTTEDWEHINPGGGITIGRNAVLKEVLSVHQAFLKGVSMSISSINIKIITFNVAIVDVVHKISLYELPKGIKHKNEHQRKTYIVVKMKGEWLIKHDQNTVIQNVMN